MFKNPYFVFALLIVFCVVDFGAWGFQKELSKSEWASWVQAIGSILAIGIAILVARIQSAETKRLALENDAHDLDKFLSAVASELLAHVSAINAIRQRFLADKLARNATIYPQTSETFYIYTACAEQIGRVEDEKLRDLIIVTYADFASFYDMLNRNSELARVYDPAKDCGTFIEKEMRYLESEIPRHADILIRQVADICDQVNARAGRHIGHSVKPAPQ